MAPREEECDLELDVDFPQDNEESRRQQEYEEFDCELDEALADFNAAQRKLKRRTRVGIAGIVLGVSATAYGFFGVGWDAHSINQLYHERAAMVATEDGDLRNSLKENITSEQLHRRELGEDFAYSAIGCACYFLGKGIRKNARRVYDEEVR